MQTGHCIKHPDNEPGSTERHATWLELFFDLVFVVAVAQITHRLETSLDAGNLLTSVGLFLPIWWIWAGHTVYATRFDTGDPPYNILTFVQMFALAAIAVQLSHFGHASANIYALAYLLARGILLVMLARAYRNIPPARPATRLYLVGFGAGALCWAASLAVQGTAKYALWGVGMAVDMMTPWYGWIRGFLKQFSVEHSHLSERFGLLIIILLGETVVAIVSGLSETGWSGATLATAVAGFLLAILIWWLYFSFLEQARGEMELRSGQPYIYIHLPLIIGIGGIGVGIQKSILAAGHHGSWFEAGLFLGAGLTTWTLAFLGLRKISGIGR
jgi:low temperature requirement protein LtrA